MTVRLVYRSYGGENGKGRPAYYDKDMALASFLRAAGRARESGADVEVVFANDGPIAEHRAALMRRHGPVYSTPRGPVGPQASYRFALDLPDLLGWDDGDVVAYNEDDYLFDPDAFAALARAADELPDAHYFALGHGRPTDLADQAQCLFYGVPPGWAPAADRRVGDVTWINILGVTSTFAGRVGSLRRDRHIFEIAQKPFRKRWLDHETAMMYQGVVPYSGVRFLTGLAEPLPLTPRGIARAIYLLPYRFAYNAKARAQGTPHYLYAPSPPLAAHLETAVLDTSRDWGALAAETVEWARRELVSQG